MSDLTIERHFDADPEIVFAYLTETQKLLQWWGPEGITISEHSLDLSRPGPWNSTMVNAKGDIYKVSGEVIAVEDNTFIEFTWAWHDNNDMRGHESRVRFDVKPGTSGGTAFTLTQTGLADEDSAAAHDEGWTSSLAKLERTLK